MLNKVGFSNGNTSENKGKLLLLVSVKARLISNSSYPSLEQPQKRCFSDMPSQKGRLHELEDSWPRYFFHEL